LLLKLADMSVLTIDIEYN